MRKWCLFTFFFLFTSFISFLVKKEKDNSRIKKKGNNEKINITENKMRKGT